MIDPDNEDPVSYKDFTRIIDDETLPHADDKTTNVEVISDNYIGMEFAPPRGNEGELIHATVVVLVVVSVPSERVDAASEVAENAG